MNCFEWEERIALYSGGDLSPAEAQALERHVADCASCQLLLSGLRASLSLVQEAHSEPIDAAHFAAVRARVLAELEHAPAYRWRFARRFAWTCAMAAAVVVLIAVWPPVEQRMILPMPSAPMAAPVATVAPAPTMRAISPAPVSLPIGPATVTPVQQRTRPQAAPTETVLVKLETDNPDVVIYWIAETKGETK
jgi:hypothetical protein